jgi:anti-sigma-K factor RskA
MSAPDRMIDDVLAGEYVLCVFDETERAAFERQLARDAGLKAAVARWQERLAELDGSAQPLPPSAALWSRIERSIAAPRRVAAPAGPSLAERIWTSLGFWRATGFAGAMASVLLAVALGLFAGRATPQPVVVAVLQEGDLTPAAIVEAFRDGTVKVVPLKNLVVPAGRTLQVWTLWDRERGPMSVGLIESARSARFTVPAYPAQREQLYEITLEPIGGSPTGRPTGPVLMKGLATTPL